MQRPAPNQRLSAAREHLRDRSLTFLLAIQFVLIFGLGPLLALGLPISGTLVHLIFATVVFVVIVAAPSRGPTITIIAALTVEVSSVVLQGLPGATVIFYWMNALGTVLAVTGLSWVVIWLVFLPGPVDRQRIIGAIVLYLNIALVFSTLFRLVAELTPNAFSGLPSGTTLREDVGDLMYFSMVTLTTVGYGDIAPVHPVARSLANLEGLFGQLYPAIFLARLVTLYRSGD